MIEFRICMRLQYMFKKFLKQFASKPSLSMEEKLMFLGKHLKKSAKWTSDSSDSYIVGALLANIDTPEKSQKIGSIDGKDLDVVFQPIFPKINKLHQIRFKLAGKLINIRMYKSHTWITNRSSGTSYSAYSDLQALYEVQLYEALVKLPKNLKISPENPYIVKKREFHNSVEIYNSAIDSDLEIWLHYNFSENLIVFEKGTSIDTST